MIKQVKLADVLKSAVYKDGEFIRIDIPIRMIAVERYLQDAEIDLLYWKMQYNKIDIWRIIRCQDKILPEKVMTQFNRLSRCIKGVKELPIDSFPITIGKNGRLIDGSHRLACYMAMDIKDIFIDVVNETRLLYYWNDEIKALYTKEEQLVIEDKRDHIIHDLEAGRWQ